MAGFSLGTTFGSSWQTGMNRLATAERSIKGKQKLALKRVALRAEREIKKGLQSGAPGGQKFKKLSPITILLTKRSKPLTRGGGAGLLGSIKHTIDTKGRKMEAFVGVHRGSKGPGGEDLVNVALIHEHGVGPYQIPVTEGVRRFFWMLHKLSGGAISPISSNKSTIMHPGIPARPFMRPTMESIHRELNAELKGAFKGRIV